MTGKASGDRIIRDSRRYGVLRIVRIGGEDSWSPGEASWLWVKGIGTLQGREGVFCRRRECLLGLLCSVLL
jgi:hypothetical protein